MTGKCELWENYLCRLIKNITPRYSINKLKLNVLSLSTLTEILNSMSWDESTKPTTLSIFDTNWTIMDNNVYLMSVFCLSTWMSIFFQSHVRRCRQGRGPSLNQAGTALRPCVPWDECIYPRSEVMNINWSFHLYRTTIWRRWWGKRRWRGWYLTRRQEEEKEEIKRGFKIPCRDGKLEMGVYCSFGFKGIGCPAATPPGTSRNASAYPVRNALRNCIDHFERLGFDVDTTWFRPPNRRIIDVRRRFGGLYSHWQGTGASFHSPIFFIFRMERV